MSTYNPYTTRQRRRRARVRQEMTVRDFMGCLGMTAVTVLAFFTAALM